jgi:uncharacterized phiE125 gp8 family phage protein
MSGNVPQGPVWGWGWRMPPLYDSGRSMTAAPRMRLKRVAEPSDLPIPIELAIAHLRLDPATKDGPEAALIELYLQGACDAVQDYSGRAIMKQQWKLSLSAFPWVWNDFFWLPFPPFISLDSCSVLGNDLVVDDHFLIEADDKLPASVYAKNRFWPPLYPRGQAPIEMTFTCGSESPDQIPRPVKLAILMALGTLYENRESEQQFTLYPLLEMGFKSLLGSYSMPGMA